MGAQAVIISGVFRGIFDDYRPGCACVHTAFQYYSLHFCFFCVFFITVKLYCTDCLQRLLGTGFLVITVSLQYTFPDCTVKLSVYGEGDQCFSEFGVEFRAKIVSKKQETEIKLVTVVESKLTQWCSGVFFKAFKRWQQQTISVKSCFQQYVKYARHIFNFNDF